MMTRSRQCSTGWEFDCDGSAVEMQQVIYFRWRDFLESIGKKLGPLGLSASTHTNLLNWNCIFSLEQ